VTVERLRQLISWTPPTEVEEGIKNTISFVDAQMMKRRIDDGV
jgi:nucleoside-diphosphate-sugar epimerase